MPNPYIKVYDFPSQMLGTGDEIKLTITFTINATGTDELIHTEEENVFINDYGSLEWEYDIENFVLIPGFLDIKISVPEVSSFAKRFFNYDTEEFDKTDRQALVVLEIRYSGTPDYVTEFKGHIIEDSITYNPDTTYLGFSAAPKTDILFKQMLWDLSDPPLALNPLGYLVISSLGYTYFYKLTKIIEDIYKLVDPAAVCEFYHDWIYKGKYYSTNPGIYHSEGYIEWPYGLAGYDPTPEEISDIVFGEIYEDIDPLFFSQALGLRTLGEVLKKLAQDWCAITGMINEGKAFFKKLFAVDEAQVYDLNEDTYIDFEKQYKFGLISYVKCKTPIETTPYEQGTFTELEGSYIDTESLLGIYEDGTGYHTHVLAYKNSKIYSVTAVKDVSVEDAFIPYGDLFTKFHFNFRSSMKNTRIDPIVTPGLNHSVIQNPRFKGVIYQPIRLKKIFETKNPRTEIDGLYLKTG